MNEIDHYESGLIGDVGTYSRDIVDSAEQRAFLGDLKELMITYKVAKIDVCLDPTFAIY